MAFGIKTLTKDSIGDLSNSELIAEAEAHLAAAVRTKGTPQSGDHAAVATAFATLAIARK